MSLGDGPSHEYRIYPRNYRFRSRIRTRYSLLCLSALLCTCCNVYTIVPPRWFFFFSLSLSVDTPWSIHEHINIYTYIHMVYNTYIHIYIYMNVGLVCVHHRRIIAAMFAHHPWNNHRQFIMLFTTCFAYIYIYLYLCPRIHTHTHIHIYFSYTPWYMHIYIYIYISSSLSYIEKHIGDN